MLVIAIRFHCHPRIIYQSELIMSENSYAIYGADKGAKRLKILHEALWPTTKQVLERANLLPGGRGIDIGCGAGYVSVELAKLVGGTGSILGVDMDSRVLDYVKVLATQNNVSIETNPISVYDLKSESEFDFAYIRFVLTHLAKPKAALSLIKRALKSGGKLIIEELDMTFFVCHPPVPEIIRYQELYVNVVRKKGADPGIGPKILNMLQDHKFGKVDLRVVIPTFFQGIAKNMAFNTLEGIKESIVNEKLAKADEVESLLKGIKKAEKNPRIMYSATPIFQYVATCP